MHRYYQCKCANSIAVHTTPPKSYIKTNKLKYVQIFLIYINVMTSLVQSCISFISMIKFESFY